MFVKFGSRVQRAAAVAALLGAATLLTSGCSGSSSAAQPSASSSTGIAISAAYIKVPTTTMSTGAFVTVTNTGKSDVTLTRVSVPSSYAASASLHKMAMVNGSMAMVPVAGGVPIPASTEVMLKPGGYHIMLMTPHVKAGDSVPLTLTFSDGTSLTAAASVH